MVFQNLRCEERASTRTCALLSKTGSKCSHTTILLYYCVRALNHAPTYPVLPACVPSGACPRLG